MKRVLLVTVFITIIVSCKKEKTATCTANMANLSATYKLTALKYKANASANEQDYLVLQDACERDDLIILKKDGTYNYQDAGTSCTPSQNDNGDWSLNGNIIISDGVIGGTIKSFDCNTLVVSNTGIYTSGDQLIFTLVKQ
jgi:Lipocalin-like domain